MAPGASRALIRARLRWWQVFCALGFLLPASTALAGWQTWLGLGAGRGGVHADRDGAVAGGELGLRIHRNSLTFLAQSSVTSSSGIDPVGEVSLLYGRVMASDTVVLEVRGGPTIVDARGQGVWSGVSGGFHLAWPATRFAGAGLRFEVNLNSWDSYTVLALQVELGKLR